MPRYHTPPLAGVETELARRAMAAAQRAVGHSVDACGVATHCCCDLVTLQVLEAAAALAAAAADPSSIRPMTRGAEHLSIMQRLKIAQKFKIAEHFAKSMQ